MTFDLENHDQGHALSRSLLQQHTVQSITKKMSHHTWHVPVRHSVFARDALGKMSDSTRPIP